MKQRAGTRDSDAPAGRSDGAVGVAGVGVAGTAGRTSTRTLRLATGAVLILSLLLI